MAAQSSCPATHSFLAPPTVNPEQYNRHEFHETCHSDTFYFRKKKKTPNDAVTPQPQSQFTPKMKANAVSRLLSSLVWIDQYNECNRMTSFMEFMISFVWRRTFCWPLACALLFCLRWQKALGKQMGARALGLGPWAKKNPFSRAPGALGQGSCSLKVSDI